MHVLVPLYLIFYVFCVTRWDMFVFVCFPFLYCRHIISVFLWRYHQSTTNSYHQRLVYSLSIFISLKINP